jgi:carbamoyltransferase
MDDRPLILGINRTQDASICLLRGSELEWAIQKERLTRQKHHWGRTGDLASIYAARMPGLDRPLDVLVECYSTSRSWPQRCAWRRWPAARASRITWRTSTALSIRHPFPVPPS